MSLYEGRQRRGDAVHAGELTSAGASAGGVRMMPNMMDGGMWGMGIGGLIALVVVALVIAALVKYVFFR